MFMREETNTRPLTITKATIMVNVDNEIFRGKNDTVTSFKRREN